MAMPIEIPVVDGRRIRAAAGTMSTGDRVHLAVWRDIPEEWAIPAAGPQELRVIEGGAACAPADSAVDDSAVADLEGAAFEAEDSVDSIE